MTKRKKSRLIFTICLMAYTVIFLVAATYGLRFLWDYMDAYERTRPNHTVDSYMQSLTADYICDRSADLLAKVDSSVQTPEQGRQVIKQALTGEFSCVKNLAESNSEQTVYLIRCNGRIIGRFTIVPGAELRHGFSPWAVASDSFDLSYLLTSGHSVTVPDFYCVTCNGVTLTQDHITETDIQFPFLKNYYADYSLPVLQTYQTGTTLGPVTLQILDQNGNPTTVDSGIDYDTLLPQCPEQTLTQVTTAVEDFVRDYVYFSSEANDDTEGNYRRVLQHIVPDTDLYRRMGKALDGLNWVSDKYAKVVSIQMNRCVPMESGRYLCDVTYLVDTRVNETVRSESHVQIIILETDDGLKAESMLTI